MSHAIGLNKSLSVILLPSTEERAARTVPADVTLPGFTGTWDLLRCSIRALGTTSLADAKNRAWRGTQGEWVLFLVEGSEIPSLDPFLAAPGVDLICAAASWALPEGPDLRAPFAIRRATLEALNGFSDLPGGVEDFELGLRLLEAHARTLPVSAWTRSAPSGRGTLDFETVLALFYRHPFQWVLSWACGQIEPRATAPAEALPDRFARLFGRPVPVQGRHSATELGSYFAERSDPPFLPAEVITEALEGADARDLCTSAAAGERLFERSHAANWLMANTAYFEAMAARNIVLHFPPPRLAEGPSAPPLTVRMEGRYEVEVGAGVAEGLRNPTLSLPLPVVCDAQRNLQLFDFEPPEFETCLDGARASAELPLRPRPGKPLRIGYSFRCQVHESLGDFAGPAPSVHQPKLGARYESMLDAMIVAIFPGGAPIGDPRQRAHRIYDWILDHIASRWSDRAGLFALVARAGNCAHRVRLFTLLCGRAGLAVRERCGVLAGDLQEAGILDGERWASTARSDRGHPLTHAWAEVFLDGSGWTPMDFLGADSGRRMMTPQNVRDGALRARLEDWSPRLERYYFGQVDPYRLHFGAAPKSLSGIPTGVAGVELDTIWRVAWGTRHTLRIKLHGLPPGPQEVGG